MTTVVGVLLAGGVFVGARQWVETWKGDVRNFAIGYEKPSGWEPEDHAPQTLFLYRHPKSNLLLRGAQSQVVSNVNPTPELNGEGIANFYVETTRSNQENWTAKLHSRIPTDAVEFHLIDRGTKGKRVISAFGVKGNTTLIVSLSGNGDEVKEMDAAIPDFTAFLKSIEFKPTLPDSEGRIATR